MISEDNAPDFTGDLLPARSIEKKRTGIPGFDDLTEGGLPTAGITAVVGGPGSGKTVFALQTLVNAFRERGERAILVAFEEPSAQIRRNFASFDWGFSRIDDNDLRLIDARLPTDTIHSGAFDLSGLLAGLTSLVETGARNVAFDGIDVLLSALNDRVLERQEMVRLSEWVRANGVTAVLTVKSYGLSERDQQRADLLQYMTDCVVLFQGHLTTTAYSRTVRIMKYRGSGYGGNPVPFVIGPSGIDVVGFQGTRLTHPTFSTRVSSGVARLDEMLGGGYIRGSCILVSGAPGTAKTILGASLVAASCSSGQRSLLISFDESSAQITSNMKSIGLDLQTHMDSGLLVMESLLSASRSPEEHFVVVRKLMDQHRPEFLVIDPLSALLKMQLPFAEMVCEQILDQAKSSGMTVLCTSLLVNFSGANELSASHVSTIADTWLHVSYLAYQGERNRALTIVKSRGTSHSNQVCELVLGPAGIEIADVYTAEGEVLMGSARLQKIAADRKAQSYEETTWQRKRFDLEKAIAELKAALQKADLDLEWKQREAQLFGLDEIAVRDRAQTDADERLNFRTE